MERRKETKGENLRGEKCGRDEIGNKNGERRVREEKGQNIQRTGSLSPLPPAQPPGKQGLTLRNLIQTVYRWSGQAAGVGPGSPRLRRPS